MSTSVKFHMCWESMCSLLSLGRFLSKYRVDQILCGGVWQKVLTDAPACLLFSVEG